MNPLLNQLSINVLAAAIIQAAKRSDSKALAWINTNTPWINRIIAFIAAIATATGIAWTYNAGTLTITGLTATTILVALWKIVQNYLAQHVFYRIMYPLEH